MNIMKFRNNNTLVHSALSLIGLDLNFVVVSLFFSKHAVYISYKKTTLTFADRFTFATALLKCYPDQGG